MALRKRWSVLVLAAAAVAVLPLVSAHAVENGRELNDDEAWTAKLMVNGQIICSASVIDPQWALTAGHCVDIYRNGGEVSLAGFGPAGSDQAATQRVDRSVKAASGRDLALLHISRPLTLPAYLRLPDNIGRLTDCGSFCDVRVYGWAKLDCPADEDCSGRSVVPHESDSKFNPHSPSTCTDGYKQPGAICSTGRVRPGDSGGPLVFQKDGPRVIGVNATVNDDGFGSHTNVLLDLDWIRASMNVGLIVIP